MYQLLLYALYLYKNMYNEELAIVWLALFFPLPFLLPYSLYYPPNLLISSLLSSVALLLSFF